MFKEQYRRDNEKLHAREELLGDIKVRAAREQQLSSARRGAALRYGVMAAAMVLTLGGGFMMGRFAGQNGAATESMPMTAAADSTSSKTAASNARGVDVDMAPAAAEETQGAPLFPAAVDSYEALYEMIARNSGDRYVAGGGFTVTAEAPEAEEAVEEAAPQAAPAPAVDMEAGAANGAYDGYSETNVQVAGVDEADVVKTDGEYLYYLTNGTLVIATADGADTAIVSKLNLLEQVRDDARFYRAREMYLDGDRLTILLTGEALLWRSNGEGWRELTCMAVYDVGDPSKPKLIEQIGQTGSYLSSRMTDGRIYLVTQQYTYSPLEGIPLSYVPAFWTDGTAETAAVESIRIPDYDTTNTYTVIGSFDAKSPSANRSLTAVLGNAGEIYCNGEHLLLAQNASQYVRSEVEPNEEGKNVAVNRQMSLTRLTLYRLGEHINFLAEGEVRGTLLNQFSMDEYKDVFRVVTTVSDWTETIFTDGIDTYEWSDEHFNCLYTLDADLNLLGSIENIAEDEWVESVRFDGDIGYFVTFRQTDPLFTVDLKDPAKPKVIGTLKIPGFSEYLHTFGEGRLFGIGYDADEKTGWRQGVKLTMFDTTKKADVKELYTKILSADNTPVGSNHRAILVDVGLGLVAFPADESYYVFEYTEQEGFVQKGKLQTDRWGSDLRGVRVGEYLYICSDSAITVIALKDFSVLASVDYEGLQL